MKDWIYSIVENMRMAEVPRSKRREFISEAYSCKNRLKKMPETLEDFTGHVKFSYKGDEAVQIIRNFLDGKFVGYCPLGSF